MILRIFYILISLQLCIGAAAQYRVSFYIKDSQTGQPISSVSVISRSGSISRATNDSGKLVLTLPQGKIQFSISASGFGAKTLELDVQADQNIEILMDPEEKQMEEVIISSTRTDTRIENTPTRVEVLGTEEVEDESGIKPAHVVSLLGDVAGIQSQQTSPVSGNTELRIQGLPGGYTQMLRDGLPLFGGYAGNFSILQIPPLDLKQIEIIKGASSTLYGGGAIAGMINIISKKPKLGTSERYLLVNQSTLRESNVNVFISERDKKRGYTFFGGGTYQRSMDIDRDGFSDLPLTEMIILHPTIFLYPNEKSTITVGLNSTFEERRGGDMLVIRNRRDVDHQFYILNRSYRNSLDASWEKKISNNAKITVKGIGSWFYRNITSNVFGLKAKQLAWFTEGTYVTKKAKHDIVLGLNLTGEKFSKKLPDSSLLPNYDRFTVGVFVQDDWRMHPKWTLETGLRTDFNNDFGTFVLPRLSLLFKASPAISSRLGGGLGYKLPTLFNAEIDERDYRIVRFDPNSKIKAERSYGANWDINFKKKFNEVGFTLNQSFYVTRIDDPLIAIETPGDIVFRSATAPLVTKGFETWLQLDYKGFEAYLGYTLVDARKKYDALHPYIDLSARNKFASVLSYQFSEHFRSSLEAAFIGRQYLEDGTRSPAYPFFAGMLRYDIKRLTIVLNCENIGDYRQTAKETIVVPPYTNPRFKQLWAPIDGRVINLSAKLSF